MSNHVHEWMMWGAANGERQLHHCSAIQRYLSGERKLTFSEQEIHSLLDAEVPLKILAEAIEPDEEPETCLRRWSSADGQRYKAQLVRRFVSYIVSRYPHWFPAEVIAEIKIQKRFDDDEYRPPQPHVLVPLWTAADARWLQSVGIAAEDREGVTA